LEKKDPNIKLKKASKFNGFYFLRPRQDYLMIPTKLRFENQKKTQNKKASFLFRLLF